MKSGKCQVCKASILQAKKWSLPSLQGALYKDLKKQVIQYVFTVLFKVSLHLKVSRMIDEAYVHIAVDMYLYVHTQFSIYKMMLITLQIVRKYLQSVSFCHKLISVFSLSYIAECGV